MRNSGSYSGLGQPRRFSTQLRPEIESLLREMAEEYEISMAQIIEDAILLFAGEFFVDDPRFEFGGPGVGITIALSYVFGDPGVRRVDSTV